MKPDTPENALAEAVRLLSQRNLSESQLRAKVLGAFPENGEWAVTHLREKRLIRDSSVADQLLARADKEGRGDRWLQHQFELAGLTMPEVLLPEVARATTALAKKKPVSAVAAARYLAGRGFTEEAIEAIIEELYDV